MVAGRIVPTGHIQSHSRPTMRPERRRSGSLASNWPRGRQPQSHTRMNAATGTTRSPRETIAPTSKLRAEPIRYALRGSAVPAGAAGRRVVADGRRHLVAKTAKAPRDAAPGIGEHRID